MNQCYLAALPKPAINPLTNNIITGSCANSELLGRSRAILPAPNLPLCGIQYRSCKIYWRIKPFAILQHHRELCFTPPSYTTLTDSNVNVHAYLSAPPVGTVAVNCYLEVRRAERHPPTNHRISRPLILLLAIYRFQGFSFRVEVMPSILITMIIFQNFLNPCLFCSKKETRVIHLNTHFQKHYISISILLCCDLLFINQPVGRIPFRKCLSNENITIPENKCSFPLTEYTVITQLIREDNLIVVCILIISIISYLKFLPKNNI